MRILIIKYSALGDILLITPSLRAIREKFKKAKIYCLTSLSGSQMLKSCPYIDEVIIYDYKGQDKGLRTFLSFGAKLRSISPDKVIDFQNSNRSHLLSFLSLAPDRFGFDNGKLSILLNNRAKLKEKGKALKPVEHQELTLGLLGIKPKSQHLELWPTEADYDYIDELLKSNWLEGEVPIVGIHIGASKTWPTKLWPSRSYAALIDELSKENIRIIIMGPDFDRGRADEILRLAKAKAVNFCAKTSINQLAALMEKCSCILTNDSLPMHMASAVARPFVALFGPTEPARHTPPAKKYITIRKDMDCSPCYKRKCKLNRCMIEISPKEVLAAVNHFIK